MRTLVQTDICCETTGQEQPFQCLWVLLFGSQEKYNRLIMLEIKVFYFLINLVRFGLLPWPALLIHIKTGFSLLQHKAFRYSIFRIFFAKNRSGGDLHLTLSKKSNYPIHRVLLHCGMMYTHDIPAWSWTLVLCTVPWTVSGRTQHAATVMYLVNQPIFILCLT